MNTPLERHARLSRNAFGRLVFTGPDGVAHEGVAPVRAFPIAEPGEGLALLDSTGHELACSVCR
jgi:hypothetical protein